VAGRVDVRGEVYLPTKAFEATNRERAERGEPTFANPRNTAAGAVRQLDPAATAKRNLAFFGYSAAGLEVAGQAELLRRLRELGVRTNPHWREAKDVDDALLFIDEWRQKRHDLDYGTDGVVVKVDRIADQEKLGFVANNPRWATAFKFPAEQATTTIEDILVYVGRTGVLTPVAALAPVLVGGTTVKRATLHNLDEVHRLDVRKGDRVVIQRAGDVIPEVVRVETEAREKGKDYPVFEMPAKCPVCEGDVEHAEGEVAYRCGNPTCPAKTGQRIGHFVGRGGMDIEGMGEALVSQLQERGFVTDPADVFFLTKDQLLGLDRFAEKSATNIYERIQAARRRPLARVINALGIPHVGWMTSEDLARWLAPGLPERPRFGDALARLRDATAEDPQALEGVGAGSGRRLARGDAGDGGDDRVVPAEHLDRVRRLQPEERGDDSCRERTGKTAPQLGAAVVLERDDQRVDLGLDERRVARAHLGEPERRDERIAMLRVVRTVAREHARADDAARREARIVDRERLVVAHHLDRQLAPGDEPAAERLHPADRADLGEERVRVLLELLERDHSRDSASSVATSATRSAAPASRTPSSSITVQKGQATASVSAPVSVASRTRSTLICFPRSSIHMCAPPAPQQNVFLPLRFISTGLPTAATSSRGSASTSL
jgi:hypothetical protein